MEKHIYVIPTNRLCVESIFSLSKEIALFEHNTGDNLKLVIIDDSQTNSRIKNKKALEEATKSFKYTESYFISSDELDTICSCIVKTVFPINIQNLLLPLLTGNYFSYGLAANRTFIMAALLDANYLHRRDSDVYLQTLYNGMILSPLEIELKYLGKNAISAENVVSDGNPPSNDLIYMVGSGYIGNWAIDYEDFLSDTNSLYKLIHISKPLLNNKEIKEYVHKKYIDGSKEVYKNDNLSFSLNTLIDVGNYSLYNIFKFLPISPASHTSGTDYFYHSILGFLSLPKLYHNRKVIHKYDTSRYATNKKDFYHLCKAKSRCATQYYNLLKEEIKSNKENFFKNGFFNSEKVGDCLIRISQKQLIKEQEEVIDLMVDVFKNSTLPGYIEIAEYIDKNKTDIINKTASDIFNHGILTKYWPQIIEYINTSRNSFKLSRLS